MEDKSLAEEIADIVRENTPEFPTSIEVSNFHEIPAPVVNIEAPVVITEWIPVSDASGTISFFDGDEPYLIIPKNHDVRMSAIANTSGIDVTGGMIGYLALVL